MYTTIDGYSRKTGRDWDLSVYIQGKEPTSASLPISNLEGWGANNKPNLNLPSSLQATCPLQLSSLDSALLCHPCPSFLCPHRQSWCPSGLALAWLPTVRSGMRKQAQCGKEMWWGGYDPTCPSRALPLLLPVSPPCLWNLPLCVSPEWRGCAHPHVLLALRGFQLAVIKTFFKLAVVLLSFVFLK